MLPAGFEPAIPASEQPQTYALDRMVAEIGTYIDTKIHNNYIIKQMFNRCA